MSFEKEFSRNAQNYEKYNIIQKEVAKKLLDLVKKETPKSMLDLGCGSGEIYKLIDWDVEKFVAVDISEEMCKIHPKDDIVKVICQNYEDNELFLSKLKVERFDAIISSSSLQWCRDLDSLLKRLTKLSDRVYFSIFCDKTFDAIYKITKLENFLPNYKNITETVSKYYKVEYKREFYKLYFEDNISKFRYIKKSGVSGGKRQLSYQETKRLIDEYPLDFLEFEVLYVAGVKV